MRPLSRQAANLPLLRRLLLSALRLLRHLRIPPFTGGLRGRPAASALCRLARRPGVAATSLRGLTRAREAHRASSNLRDRGETRDKKMGCSTSTPKVQSGKTTASSRPFSFRPWLPSSPFFSPQVVVTQPPTNHLVVTTGGLSHPPSYQM